MDKKNSFFLSLKFAFNGLLTFFSRERNGRIQLIITLVALAFSWIFAVTKTEWVIVLLLCGLVMAAEMLNTAVEKLADRITTEYDEKIKVIKDISAGFVLMVSVLAVVIGLIIFIPYFADFFS